MKCVIWVSYEVRMVAILRYYYINYFQQEPLYQWEFQFIRKYGTEKKVFSIHAGSRTKTGEVKTLGILMLCITQNSNIYGYRTIHTAVFCVCEM